jgi:hypothetical protein
MARRQKIAKRPKAKTVLRLPNLEQSKNAVLNSLAAASSQESCGHAIDEFIGWYCSGATPGFQPDGRPPIPPLPGAEESCALHNQCPVGRCAATRAQSL